jgi:hypothetical protein
VLDYEAERLPSALDHCGGVIGREADPHQERAFAGGGSFSDPSQLIGRGAHAREYAPNNHQVKIKLTDAGRHTPLRRDVARA